jgi:diguanylate cyclase (GGDEF)-like protein
MQIDTMTLMIPGSFAAAVAGVVLLIAWTQDRTAQSLLWWAAASFLQALGVGMLLAGIATGAVLWEMIGIGASSLAPALYWGGLRRFNGRRAPVLLLLAGPATWLASGAIEHVMGIDHQKWSTFVSFAVWWVYLLAGPWELWRRRDEKLNARWGMVALLALHTLVYVGGSIDLVTGVLVLGRPPVLFSWFGAIHFESILFSMAGSILMILLCKERVELGYIEAAGVDSLTGVANRRALLEGAERVYRRCQESGAPLSVVMFDLDHFKAVNDTLGHEVGDRVLRGFAQTVRAVLRPSDLFGRYGGEEFLLVMPNVSIEAAIAIADRARQQFALDYRFIDGQPLTATVSAGAAAMLPELTLDRAIAAADTAMYAAKHSGRNRVERAPLDPPGGDGKVIRLA